MCRSKTAAYLRYFQCYTPCKPNRIDDTDLYGFVELLKELVECLDAVVEPKRLLVFTEKVSQLQS